MELLMRILIAVLLAALPMAPQETEKRTYVIRIVPARPGFGPENMTEKERAAGGEHFAYLKKAFVEGKVTYIARTDDPKNLWGIVVTAPTTEAEAHALLENDPGVKAGLFKGEVSRFLVLLKAP
jgi:hypothetical protein